MDVTEKMVEAAAQVLADRFNDALGWKRGSIEACPNADGQPGGMTGFLDDARAALSAALEQEQEAVGWRSALIAAFNSLQHYAEKNENVAHSLSLIEAALASPVATREDVVQGWQDIATAPKDGTDILAFNCRHMTHSPVVVFWKTNPDVDMVGPEHHWADAATAQGTALYYNGNYFSHWQPLPAPPALPTLLEGGR